MCQSSLSYRVRDDSDQFSRLGPKALAAAIFKCCGIFIWICILIASLRFSFTLLGVSLDLRDIPWFALSISLLAIFVWSLTITIIRHFFRSYKLSEQCLHSKSGVFWNIHTAVPLNRVQHAEVVKGLFERLFGLATLTVHTAGPGSHEVSLKHLDLHVAREMLKEIIPESVERSDDAAEPD